MELEQAPLLVANIAPVLLSILSYDIEALKGRRTRKVADCYRYLAETSHEPSSGSTEVGRQN